MSCSRVLRRLAFSRSEASRPRAPRARLGTELIPSIAFEGVTDFELALAAIQPNNRLISAARCAAP